MINQHPSAAVLHAFVEGDMDAAIAIMIASHVEMCPQCQMEIQQLTHTLADNLFLDDAEKTSLAPDVSPESDLDSSLDFDLGLSPEKSLPADMLENIMSLPIDKEPISDIAFFTNKVSSKVSYQPQYLEHSEGQLCLPRALNQLAINPWKKIGKVSRARLDFEDDEMRLSLLKIEKGGQVPQHTHTGIEITLLLEGQFEDDMGRYEKGDFIWLDKAHTHSPVTQDGCICLTLASDALIFTKGISKLLNPLAKHLY